MSASHLRFGCVGFLYVRSGHQFEIGLAEPVTQENGGCFPTLQSTSWFWNAEPFETAWKGHHVPQGSCKPPPRAQSCFTPYLQDRDERSDRSQSEIWRGRLVSSPYSSSMSLSYHSSEIFGGSDPFQDTACHNKVFWVVFKPITIDDLGT